MIRALIEVCAKALRVEPADVRVTFTVSGPTVRCTVAVAGQERIARYAGGGTDELAATAVIIAETEKDRVTTLAREIERLEEKERAARQAALVAEDRARMKEKELRTSEERAARAAKAFQDALRGVGEKLAPALEEGGDDDG